MKYYSIKEFAAKIGKSVQTLRSWDKNGTLKPFHVKKGGARCYSQEQLDHFLGIKPEVKLELNKKIIGYCSVNSCEQKDDLEMQIENIKTYMYDKDYQFEIITDIENEINYNRKGLNQLIDMVINSEVDKVVILNKDILAKSEFKMIEDICNKYETTIEIIGNIKKTEEQEAVED